MRWFESNRGSEKFSKIKKGVGMLIVHSDRMGISNTNTVIEIKLMGRYIRVFTVNGDNHAIAAYDSEERTEAVFLSLIERCRLTQGDDVILLPKV